MDFSFTPEQKAFKEEVRQFLQKEVTEEVTKELETNAFGASCWTLIQKLGARGWLTPTWPKKYGGLEASNIYRYIITNELAYYRGPYGLVGAGMAGPVIHLFGTDEQKDNYLPRIARGEIEFALGYTEPQAGSDLAALEIRAVESDDYYVINGQKCFNSASHYAQYHWLGARTSTTGPKHKGISLFIVPLDCPGITIRPMWCMDGMRTNEVFYDDVRVPKKNLVGQENRGFYHILTALDFERIFPIGGLQRLFEELCEFVKETKQDASTKSLSQDPIIRQKIAQIKIEIEVAQLLAYRVVWMLDNGIVANYEASMLKLYYSELNQRLAATGLEIIGPFGSLARNSQRAKLQGWFPASYMDGLRRTIIAGTSEVQRNVIATRGLGLPR